MEAPPHKYRKSISWLGDLSIDHIPAFANVGDPDTQRSGRWISASMDMADAGTRSVWNYRKIIFLMQWWSWVRSDSWAFTKD